MLTQFAALLDEFRQLPVHPERLPTLMEVAGYPHYENVCSNILAFFLDPGRPHGLGTLFLDAIAQIEAIQNQGEAIDSDISVDREARTDAGNRIDILIQSDTHVILIENKIFGGVDNPLPDYAAYAEALEPAGRHIHKFLLTLTPNNAGADHGFRNVTHGHFVQKIRELFGHYVAGADTRYLTFMLDFLNTLDNLQRGMVMNPELVGFLRSRSDEVENFLGKVKAFKDELREKVKGLGNLVNVNSPRVNQWMYREALQLYDILVHDIKIDYDFKPAVDTVVSPNGWEIQIFPRASTPLRRERLQDLLQDLKISFEQAEQGTRFAHTTRFDYAADLGHIAPVVQDVVHRIAHSA